MSEALSAVMVSHTPRKPHVVIVGGGLSGLATATSLVDRGVRITILESRPRLGGRAGSFTDPATGELVDNCQHVSMACCTNLAEFCRKVGIRDLFRQVPEVVFLSDDGRVSTLKAGPLPAPFHLSGSFLRANYLSLLERLRVAYGLIRLRFDPTGREGEPFAEWLLRHGQTPRTVERYWATVLVSALNERLDRMDLTHARKVFLDGFLRNREGFVMEVPLVPLGDLYGTRMETWLEQNQVEVRLTTGVRSIEVEDDGAVQGVTLRNGERIAADFVVLSVPFDRVPGFFSEASQELLPSLQGLKGMAASPITGVHLWFDREVCPIEHAVTVGRTVQWVFNHTKIQNREAPEGGGQYLQLVISAAYDLVAKSKEQILEVALNELAEMWPAAREAKLVRWWVVTEHGATFAVRPGIETLRPDQRTPIEGLFFSGDWTSTGWPATMEGAVRSGFLAAQGILEDLGSPESLLKPDLPDSWLAGFLLGPPTGGQVRPYRPRVTRVAT